MHPYPDPPLGWPKPRRSAVRVLASVFLGLVSVLLAVAVPAGDFAEASGYGLTAVVAGHVAAIGITGLWRPRPAGNGHVTGVTDQGEKGRAFSYARLPYYLLTVTLAGTVLLAARPPAIVAFPFAVFLGWFLVVLLRLAPGTLVLTPTGIYHRSLVLEHFLPWDAVVDVQARDASDPWITVKALPAAGTRVRRHTGRLQAFEGQALPFLVVPSSWLGANAVPAYQATRFYFDHPEWRAELAS
ncbi:hypothetical protein [Actinoplanes sp. NPDC023714]|uniref:hypothetical protein n=1 Tax=Actinoplanes sp. NPDC023714 TaxID=3154322 RepID=UPI0033D03FF5